MLPLFWLFAITIIFSFSLFSFLYFLFFPPPFLLSVKGGLAVCCNGGWSTLPLDLCDFYYPWDTGHFCWCQLQCHTHWPLSLNLLFSLALNFSPQKHWHKMCSILLHIQCTFMVFYCNIKSTAIHSHNISVVKAIDRWIKPVLVQWDLL